MGSPVPPPGGAASNPTGALTGNDTMGEDSPTALEALVEENQIDSASYIHLWPALDHTTTDECGYKKSYSMLLLNMNNAVQELQFGSRALGPNEQRVWKIV